MNKALVMGLLVSLSMGSVVASPYSAVAQNPDADLPVFLEHSPVQQAAAAALTEGIVQMNASGGAVVVLDANTGQIMSLVSVGNDDDANRIGSNRAINNVQEVGGVMAVFAIAQALEEELITEATQIETPPSLSVAGIQFRDHRPHSATMKPAEILTHASYVGTAQIGRMIGPERQQQFLDRLGFFEPHPLEELYPTQLDPVRPTHWGELSAMTVAAGHGLSASPLQIATAYASIVNGGTRVYASFQPNNRTHERVISEETSTLVREMLRGAVLTGTASLADVPGYSVGGRSGSSDLRLPSGEFDQERGVVTFVAVFPFDAPRYIVVAQLENPVYLSPEGEERRSAGWTVVPVTRHIIEQVSISVH